MTKAIQIRLPSADVARRALTKLSGEIDKAPSLAAVEQIANMAAGYQRAFKPVKDVADQAGGVWIKAERKIGKENEKLDEKLGKARRGRAGPGRGKKLGTIVRPGFSKGGPTNEEKGLTKKRAARAAKLALIPEAKLNSIIKKLQDEGKGVTPNAILVMAVREIKANRVHKVATAKFSKTGPFDVVVIDPPWPM